MDRSGVGMEEGIENHCCFDHFPNSMASDSDSVSSRSGTPAVIFRVAFRNTVLDALGARDGWEETSSETDWDIFWSDVAWVRENLDRVPLEEHQRVNHFRNHYELTRKDLLVKNVKRMKRQLEREDRWAEAEACDFVPQSYVLPGDYSLFVEGFKRSPGSTWIMKPTGRAQGKGIFLIHKLSQVAEWKRDHRWRADAPQAESYIVQKYVADPYLIGGKKFDCRLYALVTSFSPLRVWFYRSGFARFSFTKYRSGRETHEDLSMHLTNVAIQKKGEAYDASVGCKWKVGDLKMFLASKHGMPAVDRLFARIQDLVVRSLLAVQPSMMQDKHCFELYGYDVIFESSLRPWLLEVNASPSLTADTDDDYRLKRALLDDTMDVIDMEGARRGDEVTVGGFDLIYDGAPVEASHLPETVSSPLGCLNPRVPDFAHLTKPRKSKSPKSPKSTHSSSPSPSPSLSPTHGAASGGGRRRRERGVV